MANFFGKKYYIDLDNVTDKCEVKKTETSKEGVTTEGLEINIFKYEVIKMCLMRVLEDGYNDDRDSGDLPGLDMNNQSESFRLAFYTLIKNKIIFEYDEDEE
jgi:hypothetical protein